MKYPNSIESKYGNLIIVGKVMYDGSVLVDIKTADDFNKICFYNKVNQIIKDMTFIYDSFKRIKTVYRQYYILVDGIIYRYVEMEDMDPALTKEEYEEKYNMEVIRW